MADLPIVVTSAGLIPQAPAALRQHLVTNVSSVNPNYTANLPGSLIEDVASTDVAAISLCDSALVETVNSITPNGANDFLLSELGTLYGITPGETTNTSVFVVFTGSPGYVVPKGFTVSDGSYQYVLQNGGIIGSGGQSQSLFAVATLPGSWAIPSGTVTNLITSVPSGVTLLVDNPDPGTPATQAETSTQFRARTMQAGLASATGMPRLLRTQLQDIPGVVPRLVSIVQQVAGSWEIICGGGDPYLVAYAIYSSLFDINSLSGSLLQVTNITNANPGVVSTSLNHGYANGQIATLTGALGMTAVNGVPLTVTVIDEKTFSIGVNTTSYPAYAGGGIVTPNFRNQVISIYDYPNTYTVPYVVPPLQNVSMAILWNTNAPNFTNPAGVATLAMPAIIDYVNNIPVGQPMNVLQMQEVFMDAVASLLPRAQLIRLVFAISINGVGVSPEPGTGIIEGDPESYFETASNFITINQG